MFRSNVFLNLHRVSLARPAPIQLPQIRKEARVKWLSGAMQVAYPFFIVQSFQFKVLETKNYKLKTFLDISHRQITEISEPFVKQAIP